jgi:hypothetical protein
MSFKYTKAPCSLLECLSRTKCGCLWIATKLQAMTKCIFFAQNKRNNTMGEHTGSPLHFACFFLERLQTVPYVLRVHCLRSRLRAGFACPAEGRLKASLMLSAPNAQIPLTPFFKGGICKRILGFFCVYLACEAD